jgi:hypothetical protein
MRKRVMDRVSPMDDDWLDLQRLAEVELTSEDPEYPIDAALVPGAGSGWRAAHAGEQTIRLLFREALRVKRIQLVFHEDEQERTQEFVIRWSAEGGSAFREIVRQQYNFSPHGATREVEDFAVDLPGVAALELKIVPDIGRKEAYASLAQLRIA